MKKFLTDLVITLVLAIGAIQCSPKHIPYTIVGKGYGVYYPKPYEAEHVYQYTYYDSLGIEIIFFTKREYNIGDTIIHFKNIN